MRELQDHKAFGPSRLHAHGLIRLLILLLLSGLSAAHAQTHVAISPRLINMPEDEARRILERDRLKVQVKRQALRAKPFHCDYVRAWAKVKDDWQLEMTDDEGRVVQSTLDECRRSAPSAPVKSPPV